MLVQLPELPVHGEDVHVVVLLKVTGQQLHGVVTGLQALLVLVDLLHLSQERPGRPCQQADGVQGGALGGPLHEVPTGHSGWAPHVCWSVGGLSSQAPFPIPHLELLLLSQQVVVLIALIQGDQHILEPVPHAQGELSQLCVQAGGDDWKPYTVVTAASGHAAPDPGHAAPVPSHLSPKPAWTFALPQPTGKGALLRLRVPLSKGMAPLTFARPNVVQVQLVSLLGSLQGALGGKEMAGGVVGLVVSAADLHGTGRCCVRGSEAQPCWGVSRESLQTRCLTCFPGVENSSLVTTG